MKLTDVVAEMERTCQQRVTDALGALSRSVESPIEGAMLWALIDSADEVGLQVSDGWPMCRLEIDGGFYSVTLTPQAPILACGERYRLDFLLQCSCPDVRGEAGAHLRASIDLECDGHDFHERSKEQAERDKKRDRDLQAIGFHVARFTGSEINRSPAGVARQVLAFMRDILRTGRGAIQ